MGRMSFKDAVDLVPDDLPDGAFWAMAHDMAGLDYGDGFPELFADEPREPSPVRRHMDQDRAVPCRFCGKKFRTESARDQHLGGKHGKRLAKEAKAAFAEANTPATQEPTLETGAPR